MNMIAAVDSKWAIGNKNKLLISIPADMKMFRQETMGKVVVMGRKTLESFPGQKPLPKRTNIVLTAKKDYNAGDAVVVHSIDELMEELKKYDTNDIYIIEFKLDKPAAEALKQIKGKDYAGKYVLSGRRVTLIGISFSSEKRSIVEELVEELPRGSHENSITSGHA